MEELYYDNKQIFITTHAIKRARTRNIAYPDQVYNVLKSGKVLKFGKNLIKFIKNTKQGSIICIGEDLGNSIIIKTIERGN